MTPKLSPRFATVVASFVVSSAGAALAADLLGPRPGAMKAFETPAFSLAMDDGPHVRRYFANLPRFERALHLAMGTTPQAAGAPTSAYVVSHQVWTRYFQPGEEINSDFFPTRFANYVIFDEAFVSQQGVFHEFTHRFVRTQLDGVYPLWFDEGLAGVFSYAQCTGTTVRLPTLRSSRAGNWMPLERVFLATRQSPEYVERHLTGQLHGQSALLVQRALVDDPAYGKQVFEYLGAINRLEPFATAVATGFGRDLDALDSDARSYAEKAFKNLIRFDVGAVDELRLGKGRELTKAEVLLALAGVSLDLGTRLDRTHELLDAAAKLPGGDAGALPLRLRLAGLRADDPAIDALHAQLAPRLEEPAVARAAGLALAARILKLADTAATPARTSEWVVKALELLDRSLSARPDDAEAAWTYAMLASVTGRDLPKARQRLESVRATWPRNAELASAMALLDEALGDANAQRVSLAAAARFAPDLERKRWAAQRLAALEAKR
jgi:hypothetical protein